MNLVQLITWPYVRKHLLRSVLTVAGIVLGVAILVAMRAANDSVLSSFTDTVDRIAGKAQLQVTSGDTGFPEEVLDRVQSVPEVRAAAPVIESAVDTGLQGQGKLLIVAVDMTGDRSLRDYDFDSGEEEVVDDPLVFLAQPDSLIVTREFADRNRLASGSRILLDTMQGRQWFTVRGILKAGGMAEAFGGNLGIMDIYAAQKVFGRGRRFDRIDIALRDGVSLEQGERALKTALGPGFGIEPPSGRGREFEELLSVYSYATNVSSLFALFVGIFIVYNAFAIAVTQRRAEIGILRALGATRTQIRTLFLIESAIAGAVGSAAGALIGLWAARRIAAATAQMLESTMGVAQNAGAVTVDPVLVIGAAMAGVVTSMIAAWIPARDAARVEPVQALQKGRYQILSAGQTRVRLSLAVAAASCAAICLVLARFRPLFYFGYLMVVAATLLVTPFLSSWMAKLLRAPMRWLLPVEGVLAADSLIQAPRRTSATVAALMLSVGLVVGTAGVARSGFHSIESWADDSLNPDFFVTASSTIAATDFRFPASAGRELERVPGVDEVQTVRTARFPFRGRPIMIVAVELAKVAKRVRPGIVAGDREHMYALAAEGKGVIVAQNLAELDHLHLGETIVLNAPAGQLRLPVLGIVNDYSNQLGTLFLERREYLRHFQDDTANIFRVYLRKGAAPEQVRRRIIEDWARGRRVFVLGNREVRSYVFNVTQQWFNMSYVQVFVAVLVAVLGIVNSLTVSITDRRRELGILRAVGGLRAQVRWSIWMEAGATGLIGLTLGAASGAINLFYELRIVQHDLAGFALGYEFPAAVTSSLFLVILLAAWAAAILPAESAVRTPLTSALEYE